MRRTSALTAPAGVSDARRVPFRERSVQFQRDVEHMGHAGEDQAVHSQGCRERRQFCRDLGIHVSFLDESVQFQILAQAQTWAAISRNRFGTGSPASAKRSTNRLAES